MRWGERSRAGAYLPLLRGQVDATGWSLVGHRTEDRRCPGRALPPASALALLRLPGPWPTRTERLGMRTTPHLTDLRPGASRPGEACRHADRVGFTQSIGVGRDVRGPGGCHPAGASSLSAASVVVSLTLSVATHLAGVAPPATRAHGPVGARLRSHLRVVERCYRSVAPSDVIDLLACVAHVSSLSVVRPSTGLRRPAR
jgi:hypothetical protein